MITCPKCGEEKPETGFFKNRRKRGITKWCKACNNVASRSWRIKNPEAFHAYQRRYYRANAEKIKADGRAWYAANPEKARAQKRKLKFGISESDFQKMLSDQSGACQICRFVFVVGAGRELIPHVDHCHKTGKVRGLLCTSCNKMLGFAKENLVSLERAIEYLKRSVES